jgi:hypothetical protein
MKTSCASTLTAFLNYCCEAEVGANYCIIDMYTVTLKNGLTLRWSTWPIPITFPTTGIYAPGTSVGGNIRVSGQTFTGAQAYIDRSRLVQALKLEVSQIKMTIRANPLMLIGTTPILAAIASGMFGGAAVWVDRLWAEYPCPGSWVNWQGNARSGFDFALGTLNWFTGYVAEVEEIDRAHAVLSVKDPTTYFSTDWPRNYYLVGCGHTFGDAGCTFDKSTVTATGTVQSGSTTTTIKTSLTQAGGLPAPTAEPALGETSDQTGVALASQTYYVVITLIGPNGESAPGPEASKSITGSSQSGANGTTDKLLTIAAPSSVSGATGWNVYVGLSSGNEQLQASFTGFSAGWTQTGPLAQGSPPPGLGTAGYFALGVIKFNDVTHEGGANAGLSSVITDYQVVGGYGVITVMPPLPSAPAAGDAFTVVPDCDKTQARCNAYSNIAHYTGCDYVPLPEQSV